eukprot:6457243-Amphidinium_carterae.1
MIAGNKTQPCKGAQHYRLSPKVRTICSCLDCDLLDSTIHVGHNCDSKPLEALLRFRSSQSPADTKPALKCMSRCKHHVLHFVGSSNKVKPFNT